LDTPTDAQKDNKVPERPTGRSRTENRRRYSLAKNLEKRSTVAVLPHEGTFAILYGSQAVPVGTGYRPGYLTRPDEAGRFPVVVLLTGLSGLASTEKEICRRLARNGLACLAIEVHDHGEWAYSESTDAEGILNLDETFEFVQSDDIFWAHQDRVGLLGFDVGGRLALIGAATRPWVAGSVVVSTPLTGDENRANQVAEVLSHLPVPILGLYGKEDQLIANETVDEAQRRNPHGQWLLYEAARHGFVDETSADFDPGASADALARIIEFFRAVLPQPVIEQLS
jgi:carboxymethylenebutenolidase